MPIFLKPHLHKQTYIRVLGQDPYALGLENASVGWCFVLVTYQVYRELETRDPAETHTRRTAACVSSGYSRYLPGHLLENTVLPYIEEWSRHSGLQRQANDSGNAICQGRLSEEISSIRHG